MTIIEDAAHALGRADGDEPVGSCRHSDMATFSFHPVKAITTGEGGIVTTAIRELRDRLRAVPHPRDRARAATTSPTEGGWYHEQQELGFNYRLTDIHSALGRSQLRRLDGFIERRNAIAARYRERLAERRPLELPPAAPAGALHAYHLFVIRHREAPSAATLYDGLRERGILAQVHYVPVYLHPWYRETATATSPGCAPRPSATTRAACRCRASQT